MASNKPLGSGLKAFNLLFFNKGLKLANMIPPYSFAKIGKLNAAFSLRNMGDLDLFLAKEVKRNSLMGPYLSLHQTMLETYSLRPTCLSQVQLRVLYMWSICKLSKVSPNTLEDTFMYRSIIGAFQYASITRPKI